MGAVGDRGSSIQDEKELGPFQGPKECYSESTGMESQRSEGQKSLYTEPYSQLSISRACQCSCLENPRDRGAWWAAVYGVAQSRTRLNDLAAAAAAGLAWKIPWTEEPGRLQSMGSLRVGHD